VFDALLEPGPDPEPKPPQPAEIAAAVMSTIILCSKKFPVKFISASLFSGGSEN
jgi:hypothetical protein